MDEKPQPDMRVRIAVPVRLRGMSQEHKFFDETSQTFCIGENSAITRLQSLVDLDTEIHLTNLITQLGGNFRVTWVNTQGRDGSHDVGLELVDAAANLWGMESVGVETEKEPLIAHAWLQCLRCHESQLTPVPETEDEFIYDGFTIARTCENCKATTAWSFTPVAVEAAARELDKAARHAKKGQDQRRGGRAPITMGIKVIRKKYGMTLEDICQTIDVSRTGTYFLTARHYEVGEPLKVVAPYKEGDVAISIPARVVRLDEAKESFYHAVAIQLEPEEK